MLLGIVGIPVAFDLVGNDLERLRREEEPTVCNLLDGVLKRMELVGEYPQEHGIGLRFVEWCLHISFLAPEHPVFAGALCDEE